MTSLIEFQGCGYAGRSLCQYRENTQESRVFADS
jgi:hypothetical protein